MSLASRAGVAGVVVGALIVGANVVADPPWAQDSAPARPAGAAQQFLAAWRRSLTTTWAAGGTFERRTDDGRTLTSEVHLAQRPPDRLSVGFGAVDARRDGRRLACATAEDGEVDCRRGGPAPPYRATVERDLALLRDYVTGRDRLYSVHRQGPWCYRLTLTRPIAAPPYGQRAEFCFDGETGAPAGSVIERQGATDRVEMTSISDEVSDGDLDPERWDRRGPS